MRLPYVHLLPRRAYAAVLRRAGEGAETVHDLLGIKATGIGIDRFERIVAGIAHRVLDRRLTS